MVSSAPGEAGRKSRGYSVMVTKEQTIDLLETIAQLLELKGENPFKIRAYTNAARALETYSGNFPKLGEGNGFQELLGFGERLAKKSWSNRLTGKWKNSENLRPDFRKSWFEWSELKGFPAKKLKCLGG